MPPETVRTWTRFRSLLKLTKEGPLRSEADGVTYLRYRKFGLGKQESRGGDLTRLNVLRRSESGRNAKCHQEI